MGEINVRGSPLSRSVSPTLGRLVQLLDKQFVHSVRVIEVNVMSGAGYDDGTAGDIPDLPEALHAPDPSFWIHPVVVSVAKRDREVLWKFGDSVLEGKAGVSHGRQDVRERVFAGATCEGNFDEVVMQVARVGRVEIGESTGRVLGLGTRSVGRGQSAMYIG